MQKRLLISALVYFIASCSVNKSPISNQLDLGYTKNYGVMSEAKTQLPPGVAIFSFNNPALKNSKYTSVMVNPVVFYSGDSAHQSQLDMMVDTNSRIGLQKYLVELLSDKLKVVKDPAANTTVLTVTITGAKLVAASDGYTPVELIDVATILSGELEAGLVLEVGAQIKDSVSGELLGSSIITISEEKLQQDVRSDKDFMNLVKLWSAIATKHAADYMVVR